MFSSKTKIDVCFFIQISWLQNEQGENFFAYPIYSALAFFLEALSKTI